MDGTGTVIDMLKPLFGGSVHGFLVILLLVIILIRQTTIMERSPPTPAPIQSGACGYEVSWKAEEGELWKWLEDRVGLKRQEISTSGQKARGMDMQPESSSSSGADYQQTLAAMRKQLEAMERAAGIEELQHQSQDQPESQVHFEEPQLSKAGSGRRLVEDTTGPLPSEPAAAAAAPHT